MVEAYKTLMKQNNDEITIEKSRFIGYSSPVASEEEAIEFIKMIKRKHKDATHNVYAYVIGYNNEIQRFNDDGEPSGTAGIPVLEMLKKEDLKNVAVVITRYYGGVKLGAGGLVRAYTKVAKMGIDAGKVVIKRKYVLIGIKIEYNLLGKVQNEITKDNYFIKETDYHEMVVIKLYIKATEVDDFEAKIIEWTNNNSSTFYIKEEYLTELNDKIIL